MVGIVLVSHTPSLAQAVAEFIGICAPDVPVALAGGNRSGGFGASYGKVVEALREFELADPARPDARRVDPGEGGAAPRPQGEGSGPHRVEGVILIPDLGSSALTARMVLADRPEPRCAVVDCPFVEGAFEAAVQAQAGTSMPQIIESLRSVRSLRKL